MSVRGAREPAQAVQESEPAAPVLAQAAPARERARQAPAYAEYAGGASNQEGWKVTTPNFAAPYYEEAIRGACAAAGIEPGDVDAVFAHGAGTALSDAYEARGLVAVFGEWPERPAIIALKGRFGHTLGASALLDAAAAAVALRDGLLPSSAGFSRHDARLKVRPLAEPRRADLKTVLKLANGFAGFNAAAVLRRPEGT